VSVRLRPALPERPVAGQGDLQAPETLVARTLPARRGQIRLRQQRPHGRN